MQDYDKTPTAPAEIPQEHPLRTLMHKSVVRAFHERLGMTQSEISGYIAELLVTFAHQDKIFALRNPLGITLLSVAEMLLEADVVSHATSFDRERAVHKHIGDFTLFWAGIYPEALKQMRAPIMADHLIDYVRQGKQSYYIVSTFQHGRYASDAHLFRQLSDEFELCMHGLNLVRREWQQLQSRSYE